jgi:hypothetical protein
MQIGEEANRKEMEALCSKCEEEGWHRSLDANPA